MIPDQRADVKKETAAKKIRPYFVLRKLPAMPGCSEECAAFLKWEGLGGKKALQALKAPSTLPGNTYCQACTLMLYCDKS